MVNVDVSVVFLNRWKRSDWFYSVNMVVYTKVPKVIAYHWALDWVDLGVLKRISMDFRYIHFKTCLRYLVTLSSLYVLQQESVIQPSRKDSSVFHLEVPSGSCPALQHPQQNNQTQLRKQRSTFPQRHKPVSVSHPQGHPVSWEACVLWFGLVWELFKWMRIFAETDVTGTY